MGKYYNIPFNTSKSTAVAITRTGVPKKSPLHWLVRFDRPHKGTKYNHININHRVTGLPDPHTKLPTGALQVSGDIFLI
jgi:hypothetical protein